MKKIRCGILLLFVFMLGLFINALEVNAVETGFQTRFLSADDKNMITSNISILLIDEEPERKPIVCFDVNGNRLIAIGQNTTNRKTICIYSNEGVFQYGYTFNCNGDFGVEWDEENLNIYLFRSRVIVSIAPNGEILDILDVPTTIENNSYVNHFIYGTHRKVGNTEYSIGNTEGIFNFFATSYSQITVKEIGGTTSIIYDVSSDHFSTMIVIFITVLIPIFSIVCCVIWQLFKRKCGK